MYYDYMSSIAGVLYAARTIYPSRGPEFLPGVLVVSVLLICIVMCVIFCLFVFVLCRVCPMFQVSMNCPFLIALSVYKTARKQYTIFRSGENHEQRSMLSEYLEQRVGFD